MVLPNTLLIGVQKAGTTSLYNWISQHPDVYAEQSMKDFPFFARDDFYNKGFDWFRNCFKTHRGEKIILHGYVNYIYFSGITAKRIYEFDKKIKMILVLRNPVERAYSAYWEQRKAGYERVESFEKALEMEPFRKNKSYVNDSCLTYIDHGFYFRQLSKFYEYFNREQILVMLFEDLIKDKISLLKETFKFLNIDTEFIPEFHIENEAGIPKIEPLQVFLNQKLSPRFLKELVPINHRIAIKNFLKRLNTKKKKYPIMDSNIQKKLIGLYSDEIKNLESLLNVDLSSWLKINDNK